MKHKGYIQPTPHDSLEQKERWELLKSHRERWKATGVKDVKAINQLTQDIRKEWLENRKKGKPITDRRIADIVRQICEFFGGEVAESDRRELGKLIDDWVGKGG